jgi:hypothetical protein
VRLLVLAWLTFLLAVPGAAAVLVLFGPGELSVPTRLALVFGLGYAIVGGAAYVLTIARVMLPVPFLLLVAAISLGLWFVAVRRRSLREHGRAIRSEFLADRWNLVIGLLVIALIGVVRASFLRNVPIISPFRYWVDGSEIADAGRIPALSVQYGRLFPPATSKVFLNAFNAGVNFATGGDALRSLASLAWIGSMGVVVGLWALGREMGLRVTAVLLPVLTLVNRLFMADELTVDAASYKAEIFGRLVAIAGLVLAIVVLRDRKPRREAVLAGALLAVAAGTHLVPFLVVGVILAWYVVARLILDRDRGRTVRVAAAIVVTTGVLGSGILLLAGGDIGFQGAQRPGQYQVGTAGFDETRYLYTGEIPDHPLTHPRWYIAPRTVIAAYFARTFRLPPRSALRDLLTPLRTILPIVGLLLAVVMLVWFPRNLRPIGLVAWGTAATLVLLALFFSFRYDVYVPAWFGVRRLYDYGTIPVYLVGLALIEAGFLLLSKARPLAGVVVGSAFVVLVAGVVAPNRTFAGQSGTTRSQVAEFVDWTRQATPCDARILINERTVGIVRALTGRVAILEGMGPFLRPDMLRDVVGLMLSARDFFDDPAANSGFLANESVDYVVVMRDLRVGFRGPVVEHLDAAALKAVPFLEQVHSSSAFDAYRVVGLPHRSGYPKPEDHPGFSCTTEPMRSG